MADQAKEKLAGFTAEIAHREREIEALTAAIKEKDDFVARAAVSE